MATPFAAPYRPGQAGTSHDTAGCQGRRPACGAPRWCCAERPRRAALSMSDTTITPGTWALVCLLPDCPSDGHRPHHPAEDDCRVQVTAVDKTGDHTVFALYK